MKKSIYHSLVCSISLALATVALPAAARDGSESRITFNKGATSAVTEGTIKGYEFDDYLLNVREGQVLNISLATKHTATYFNLIEPGETDVAVFIGSTSGNQFEGPAKKSGDYRIRVYMMRSAARRGEVANYRLETIVAGAVHLPLAPGDALVPGTNYHATGPVRCHIGTGAMQSCNMGVVRQGGGSGSVTVTKPDGRTRTIFFEKGKATGYDFSQADPGAFSAWRQDDNTVVHIGDETYFLPDAIIFGG